MLRRGSRRSAERALLALAVCAAAAQPAAAGCVDSANDAASFNECARREILPLEAAVVHRVNELRSKHRSDAALLKSIEASDDAWNAYRHRQCELEAALGGEASEAGRRRAYALCARRALERRLDELGRQ